MIRIHPRIISIVVALLLISGCAARQSVAGAPVPPPCPAPEPPPESWTRARPGALSLRVPPEYRQMAVRGIDSHVGEWRSGRSRINFDFGWYSNPLLPTEDVLGYQACTVEIGGRPARVVSYWSIQGRRYLVGAHWVLQEGVSSDRIEEWRPKIALTVYATTPSAQEADRLRAVLWSVEIDE
jgi:hypothetical protein